MADRDMASPENDTVMFALILLGAVTVMLAVALLQRLREIHRLRELGERYLQQVTDLGSGGMLELGSIVAAMYPRVATDDFLARATALADDPATPPYVRAPLLKETDTLRRKLRARG